MITFISILLYDSLVACCLTQLAIHFDKWWIILFLPLLVLTYKERIQRKDGDEDNGNV